MATPRQAELFEHALSLPAAERPAWLDRACGPDRGLRASLESLLRASEQAGDFLPPEDAAFGPAGPLFECLIDDQPRDRIGRYRLREKLGEGGCGVVYLAEQDDAVRRRVALKVIKLGMDTRAVIGRFAAERQALARMEHPNIARVLDAGATESGRPYFVMELVPGLRLTDYCDHNCLDVDQRLELFAQVCQAIQHAHQKGIIHRDIKPSNILVALPDREPVPKVIDFGIAKATQGRLTDQTVFTAYEQFIGTPAYVSPEQAGANGLDVDTRSDIYSLGVLLYELLAGRTPFDTAQLTAGGLVEMRRRIREQEPPRPSQRFRALNDSDRTAVARLRGTDGPRLAATLAGDLDWIVMRCLEKDPARRYDTASDLAADIQHYRRNEPVLARPPSTAYLLRKLVRRHRVGFAAGAAVAATLACGFAVSTTLYLRGRQAVERARQAEESAQRAKIRTESARLDEARQRAVAEAERRRAEDQSARRYALAQLVTDAMRNLGLLASIADPHTFRHVLEQAARLKAELADHPEIEAGLDETLGGACFRMGEFKRAEELFLEAIELRRRAQGEFAPAGAQSLGYLGLVYAGQSKWPEAESCFRDALQILQASTDPANPEVTRTMSTFGWVLAQQAKFSEAETYLELALERQRRVSGPIHADVAATLGRLGSVLSQEGRVREAEQALRESLGINRQVFGSDSPEAATALNVLAVTVALDQRRLSEAIALYREAFEIRERHRSPPATAMSGGAGSIHGFVTDARLSAARAQPAAQLESMLVQRPPFAQIDTVLRESRRHAQIQFPQNSWEEAFYLALTAWVLLEERRFGEAESAARQCLAIRRTLRPDDWSVCHAQHLVGAARAGLHQGADAEPLLVEGYRGMKARLDAIPEFHLPRLGESAKRLVNFYAEQGRLDEAARWQAELDSLAPAAKQSLALPGPARPPAANSFGAVLE